MNCKPGDLALWVTRGVLVNVDRVFWSGEQFKDTTGRLHWFSDTRAAFVVTCLGAPQVNRSGTSARGCFFQTTPVLATSLRPIRGQPGEDETLTWAGKPEQITA